MLTLEQHLSQNVLINAQDNEPMLIFQWTRHTWMVTCAEKICTVTSAVPCDYEFLFYTR